MPEFCLSRGGPRQIGCLMDSSNTVFPLSCSLHNNNLGEQTGIALGKALETNTSLQHLE